MHKELTKYLADTNHQKHILLIGLRMLIFFEAISNYLKDERVYIQENIEKLNEYIPFKKNMEK